MRSAETEAGGSRLLDIQLGTVPYRVTDVNTDRPLSLVSGATNSSRAAGAETPLIDTVIYVPRQGAPFDAQPTVRPIQGAPLLYTWCGVDIRIAPVTIQNLTAETGEVVVNIYSDNAYVYQQIVTISPNAHFPIYFGAQSMGYIQGAPGLPGMPVVVTMTPTKDMLCLRNTNRPATHRSPNPPNYPSVAGLSAQLIPLD